MKIYFLRGLNTLGTDDLQIGPFQYGPMSAPLAKTLTNEPGIEFIPITGMGCGSIKEQGDRALAFLKNQGIPNECVLLGHSVGGLIARELASRPEMKGRVRKLISMGTPHRGARVAEIGMNVDERYPLIFHAMRIGGYDTRSKTSIIGHYTREAIEKFNISNQVPIGIEEISLLCEAEWRELSWPYFLVYHLLHPVGGGPTDDGKLRPASDGFIYSESQKRGRVVGPFAIDHYGEMGFFFQLNPFARRRAVTEFKRMVTTILELARN